MCTKIVTTVFPVITANTDDGKMANVMNGRICNQFHLRNQPEQILRLLSVYIKKWKFNDTFKNHDVPFNKFHYHWPFYFMKYLLSL